MERREKKEKKEKKKVKIIRTNWWHRHATKEKSFPTMRGETRKPGLWKRRSHKAAPINIYETFEESNNGAQLANIGLIN